MPLGILNAIVKRSTEDLFWSCGCFFFVNSLMYSAPTKSKLSPIRQFIRVLQKSGFEYFILSVVWILIGSS